MKRLILWDLDGTLIDTLEDLGAAVNHALGLRGLPLLGLEDFRHMVGHGVQNLVAQALAEALRRKAAEDPEEKRTFDGVRVAESVPAAYSGEPAELEDSYVDSALADFKEYYSANIDVHTRPYPGMPELLSELAAAGVRMAVVSNKFQEGTERLVCEFFPDIDFVAILGNRPGWPLKPSPVIVEEVLGRAGAVAGNGIGFDRAQSVSLRADAVLVGDSPTDMRTAANGGIDALAVAWGYRSPEELTASLATCSPAGTDRTPPPRIARTVDELRRMLVSG
ncbi:MAG: HAD hydrolase-like protein [Bacteroidales bacterium]|nr:HAD hydrolase-like protein [Bacteroidales bacterium]